MRRAQKLALISLAVLTGGSLLVTGGYAWYLRSGLYRASCAARLSTALGLPSEIGRVVPRSRNSREFQRVRIWLPERRGVAAFVNRAIVTETPTADDPNAHELELIGGQCEISTRTWLREDYRMVLESGLRPGFDPDGPRKVVFSNMDLVLERDRFRVALAGASGVVRFESPQIGEASIACDRLNGYRSTEPATLGAVFTPQETGIRLDLVDLTVPSLPLAIMHLDDLAGLELKTGSFDGRLSYSELATGKRLTVGGRIHDLRLAEVTAGLFPRPWRGSAPELELMELTVLDRRFERVRFGGVLTDVVLGDIGALWGLGDIGGTMVLRVREADFSTTGIQRLILSGRCDDISLEQLTASLGYGRMTGQARLVISDLTITDNHLASLDAEIVVEPSDDTPYWIERALLSELLQRATGIALPTFLPERFEYTRLGVRLEVRDEMLYVFGTYGPGDKTILTARVAGQDWDVLRELEEPIDLRPGLDELRRQATAYVEQRLRAMSLQEAWRALWPLPKSWQPAPPSRPAPPE